MTNIKLRNKKWLSYLLPVSLFSMIFYVGIHYKDSIIEVLSTADPYWLGAGIICYVCNYLFRAYRLWLFALKKGQFFPVYLRVAGLHGFNSYFLPLRSGDLTLPFLLQLHAKIPLVTGSRFLIRARMLDIFCLGFLLFGATLFTETTIDPLLQILFLLIGLVFIVFPYCAIYMMRRGENYLRKWLVRVFGKEKPGYPHLVETLISFVIWFWTGMTIFCVMRSLEIPLTFMDVWFLAAIQLPLQLLPVQGVANAGNHEAGWLVGLGMLGISFEQSLPFALSSHVIIICYVALLGIIASVLPSSDFKTTEIAISKDI